MAKKLLDFVFYLSNSLASDEDTHFSRTVTKELYILNLTQNQNQNLHCLYHLPTSEKGSFNLEAHTSNLSSGSTSPSSLLNIST